MLQKIYEYINLKQKTSPSTTDDNAVNSNYSKHIVELI